MKDKFYYIQLGNLEKKLRRFLTKTLPLIILFKLTNSNQKSIKEKIGLTKTLKYKAIELGVSSVFAIVVSLLLFVFSYLFSYLFSQITQTDIGVYVKWIFLTPVLVLFLLMSLGWILLGLLGILTYKSKIKFFPNKTLKKPPVSLLHKIALLLPEKYRRDIEQNISDMRLEYYEALNEKKIWQSRFIVAFYYIGLSWSVVLWISDKVKEVVGIIPKKN